jgi:hypothetical protein
MNRTPREPGRLHRRIALGISLLLNLVFVAALYIGTLPHRAERAIGADHPMRVRLIEAPDDLAPPAHRTEPVPAAPEITMRRPRDVSKRAVSPPAAPREEAGAVGAPPLRLFDANGRVLLPESTVTEHAPAPADSLARRNAMPYAPTRFERAWTPRDESLGEALVRETTVSHTWSTPWGTRVSCAASFVMAFIGGCGWGYAPTLPIEELKRLRADPPPPRADAQGKSLLARPAPT